ncbi:hypothetical protein ACT7C7_00595 [Bacillus cereus]
MKKTVRNLFIASCLAGSVLPGVANASTDVGPKNSKKGINRSEYVYS